MAAVVIEGARGITEGLEEYKRKGMRVKKKND